MAATGAMAGFEKLEGSSNYSTWKFAMEMQLKRDKLWTVTSNPGQNPNAEDVDRAMGTIGLAVKAHVYSIIQGQTTADLKSIQSSAKVPVKIIKLDVTEKEDIAGLPSAVQKVLGPNQGLNLLINNAGYGPLLSWEETTAEEMNKILSANTTAPFMVIKALLPLLRMAADQSSEPGMSCSKAAVVNISSILGSMHVPLTRNTKEDEDRILKFMAYSSSKAALNMCMRYVARQTLSYGVLVALLHPGWVQTDMGGSAAPLTAQESVSDMLKTIASWNQENHGLFYDNKGKPLEW